MHRTQKIALFNIIVIFSALALSLITFCVAYYVLDLPFKRAILGFVFLSILGLRSCIPLIFNKESSTVTYDERDSLIHKKASLGAYSIFWFYCSIGSIIPLLIVGVQGKISVLYLPIFIFFGRIIINLTQSILLLIDYGWSKKENESDTKKCMV
ncbi:MAG: hypothetical protein JXA96_03355 [Sedimentisphaerales bacterium]|nr:hypothetical protein [Sedimentisphaerales bacterium]